jgi:hypothetical protein
VPIHASLRRTTAVSHRQPRTLAVALVIPAGLLQRLAGPTPISSDTVGVRAERPVETAERRLGRTSERMEPNNPGFDLKSTDNATGRTGSIEVKGRIVGATTFFVTSQEIRYGQNTGDQFRLALVDLSPDGPAHDIVRYVEGPFENVSLTALISGVQFEWPKPGRRTRAVVTPMAEDIASTDDLQTLATAA